MVGAERAGHVYKFGTPGLRAGKQSIIHTGDGTKYTTSASKHLYWAREWYVHGTILATR
jgi:hypothetical protein